MAKDYFQDVHPASEGSPRSIRNIPATSRPRTSRMVSSDGPISRPRRRKGGKWILWVIAAVALIGVGAVVFALFGETSVSVIPRQHTVVFDETATYTAYPAGSQGAGAIIYTTVTRTYEDSMTVQATGSEEVEDVASGRITVLNDFSEEPQRLIPNTRFETPEGLVFRIRNAVVVPGKRMVNGVSQPGSIEVTVYADQPGEDYNIGPVSRFTLPGLRNSEPQMYASIYGRSTAPMSGGFVGERPVVNDSVLASARSQMRDRLAARIEAEELTDIEGSYAVPELAEITYESLPPQTSANGVVTVREQANVLIPVFDQIAFATAIAAETAASADDGTVTIAEPSTFTIRGAAADEESELGSDPIDFSLNGTATFVGSVDVAQLARDLAGKDRNAFEMIVSSYPGIETATANLSPFWRGTFPEDPAKIRIDVAAPQAGA